MKEVYLARGYFESLKLRRIYALIVLLNLVFVHYGFSNTAKTGMRDITAQELVFDMGAGWNLGNSLDAECADEICWFNPFTTQEMIDAVAQQGFKTLRLPVTWRFHTGPAPDYIIETDWLDRVEEIANYAFNNDMYVIINTHHDDPWIIPTYEKLDEVKNQLEKLWIQIANRFSDYGDYLIFETLNEPRYEGSDEEWTGGTAEGRDCVNQYHQVSVDAIRSTGGNNTKRFLMIATYAASTYDHTMNALIIPNNDKNTIISLHSYSPYEFCLANIDQTWGTAADKSALDAEFDRIYNKFVANGHPVVMGEWGSLNQDNTEDRTDHASYFTQGCLERGICPIVWDNGGANEFGIFDRDNVEWFYPGIADALIDAAENTNAYRNPIIKHIRTADPSAQVWDDGKVWVYTSHDQGWATGYNSMDGYHVFSSYDMVNWTDHGEILHSRDVNWGLEQGGWMFAPDAAYKDGTYYLYFPHMAAGWNWRIGVATSDIPEGPFTDVGHYIEGTDQIDPCCFIDDDGIAYLIWGGDHSPPKIARLKENMVELDEEPRIIEYGEDDFFEAAYMHKYKGKYYFSYNCNTCWPNTGQYAISDSPYGPFEHKGTISPVPEGAQIHNSMIEYHGQWYYFYHVGNYGDDASMYRRNVSVDSMFYNEDGTVQEVIHTRTGVGPDTIGMTAGILVPGRVEAEDYFRMQGIDTLSVSDTVTVVSEIHDGDWFDFVLEIIGDEIYDANVRVMNPVIGSNVYLLVDEAFVDTIPINANTDTLKTSVFLHRGKHTLKLLFENESVDTNLIKIDWIDLYGDIDYYKIEASSSAGGTIQSEGTAYVAEGDSMVFNFQWQTGYKPDSIRIDGINESPSTSYTFRNVTANHSIEAQFTLCIGTSLIPFIRVNTDDPAQLSDTSVFVGEDLGLSLQYEGEGVLSWVDPYGENRQEAEFRIENITIDQKGVYSAQFIDSTGCKSEMKFNIGVAYPELDVYQAEDWKSQSGVQAEGCSDIGGGENIGFIENGDWSSYQIDFEESGIYEIIARVATATGGGRIEFSIDGKVIATVPVSNSQSSGWQDWYTTVPVEAGIYEGTHEIRLTYRGGGGYLFNVNWFDLELVRATAVDNIENPENGSELLWYYPNPNNPSEIGISYILGKPASVSLSIVNITGTHVRTLIAPQLHDSGTYNLTWNGTNDQGVQVPEGIYLVVFNTNNKTEVKKVLFLI